MPVLVPPNRGGLPIKRSLDGTNDEATKILALSEVRSGLTQAPLFCTTYGRV